MKVIFLDFDGVLITRERMRWGWPHTPEPKCVEQLNRITDRTGAKIVVSSSWRIGLTTDELAVTLNAWGVTGEVVGATPLEKLHALRGDEIQQWLNEWNNTEFDSVEDFIILDDDRDMAHLLDRLIQTNVIEGLTRQIADLTIQRLTSKVSSCSF